MDVRSFGQKKRQQVTSRQPTKRGAMVRIGVGATKHGNENRKYDLLSPAHAAAGRPLGVSFIRRETDEELLQNWIFR